jgi:hypothetical protein
MTDDNCNEYIDAVRAQHVFIDENYNAVIQEEHRCKWCLCFGTRFMFSFDTRMEAESKQKESPLSLTLVGPRA